MYAIVDGDWKLIQNVIRPPDKPEFELFDFYKDPLDQKNVAAEHPDVVARLAKGLDVEPFLTGESNAAAVKAFLEGIEFTYKFLPGGGEHFRRAVELDPHFIAARTFLVSGLAAAGDTGAALEQVKTLESLKPKATAYQQALIGWSEAVVRGDREAKIRYSRVGLGLEPRNNFSLFDMSDDLWTLDRSQEAVQTARQAMGSGWRFDPRYTRLERVEEELGLLAENGGEYEVVNEVSVSVMKDFLRVGTLLVPRFVFYAVLMSVFAFYLTVVSYPLVAFVPVLGWACGLLVLCAGLFWYEAARAWHSAPSP